MQIVSSDGLIQDILNLAVSTIDEFEEQQKLNSLKLTLYMALNNLKIYRDDDATELPSTYIDRTEYVIKQFSLYLEENGRSEKTIENYKYEIVNFFRWINKSYKDIKYKDIRAYLAWRRRAEKNKDTTINNKIHALSSFYNFVMKYGNTGEDDDEDFDVFYDFIPPKKNPMDRIEAIKTETKYKGAFTDEDVVKIRDECKHIQKISSNKLSNLKEELKNKRNLAIVDLLLSSGVRISELCMLNISDIKLNEKEFIVYGKGRKERLALMDSEAKIHIQKYLDLRRELSKDSNPALFISIRKPYTRLTDCSIRTMLNSVGQAVNVEITPHKFRRTYATRLLENGAPIDVVADLMGHEDVNTTKRCYAKRNVDRIRNIGRGAI